MSGETCVIAVVIPPAKLTNFSARPGDVPVVIAVDGTEWHSVVNQVRGEGVVGQGVTCISLVARHMQSVIGFGRINWETAVFRKVPQWSVERQNFYAQSERSSRRICDLVHLLQSNPKVNPSQVTETIDVWGVVNRKGWTGRSTNHDKVPVGDAWQRHVDKLTNVKKCNRSLSNVSKWNCAVWHISVVCYTLGTGIVAYRCTGVILLMVELKRKDTTTRSQARQSFCKASFVFHRVQEEVAARLLNELRRSGVEVDAGTVVDIERCVQTSVGRLDAGVAAFHSSSSTSRSRHSRWYVHRTVPSALRWNREFHHPGPRVRRRQLSQRRLNVHEDEVKRTKKCDVHRRHSNAQDGSRLLSSEDAFPIGIPYLRWVECCVILWFWNTFRWVIFHLINWF